MIDSIDKLEWNLNNRGKELPMKQVAVIGGPGTGKYTLAKALMGGRIDLPLGIVEFSWDVNLQQKKEGYEVNARLTDGTEVAFSDRWREEIYVQDKQDAPRIHKLIVSCDMPYPNLSVEVTSMLREDPSELTDTVMYSDAIIVVINASRLFVPFEREFIFLRFYKRQLKNVFFVVNNYNMVREQDEETFREKVRHELYDVFTDRSGNFNEKLYNSRVFFVDAHTSLCARTGTPLKVPKGGKWVDFLVSKEVDQYTGVPELERELYRFLGYIN